MTRCFSASVVHMMMGVRLSASRTLVTRVIPSMLGMFQSTTIRSNPWLVAMTASASTPSPASENSPPSDSSVFFCIFRIVRESSTSRIFTGSPFSRGGRELFDIDFNGKIADRRLAWDHDTRHIAEPHNLVAGSDHNSRNGNAGGGTQMLFSASGNHVGQFSDGVGEFGCIGLDRHSCKGGSERLRSRHLQADDHAASDVAGKPDDARHVIARRRVIFQI